MEHQVLGQRIGVAPDRPADAGVDQPVLVARGVDRLHPGQAEVPLEVRIDERGDEAARRRIDVHRDVEPGLGLVAIERRADVRHGLVGPVERRAEHRDDADRVLVAVADGPGCGHVVLLALHGDEPWLDLPVPAELLPAHLDVGAHHHVGPVRRPPRRPLALAPTPLERHPGQHRRLARPGGRRAGGLLVVGRVPEPAEHVDAPLLELGRAGVLVLVDHVLVERLGHQVPDLGFHPRRHERRQVEPGVAVEHQLVVHELVRGVGSGLEVGDPVPVGAVHLARSRVDRAEGERREILDELAVQSQRVSLRPCQETPKSRGGHRPDRVICPRVSPSPGDGAPCPAGVRSDHGDPRRPTWQAPARRC